jgi:hypothetical protein
MPSFVKFAYTVEAEVTFTREEYTIVVEGIMNKMGLNPKKVELHRADIRQLLEGLPSESVLQADWRRILVSRSL